MKIDSHYTVKKYGDVTYLLPFGQAIADNRQGIRLNETGLFLLEHLPETDSAAELVDLLCEHYEAEPEERPIVEADVTRFLAELKSRGILPADNTALSELPKRYLRIAGITLCLEGPEKVFSGQFDPFAVSNPQKVDLTVRIHIGAKRPASLGQMILHNEQVSVLETDGAYHLLFPPYRYVLEGELSKDGSLVTFYLNGEYSDDVREELFHAIRPAFLYLAGQKGMAAIHSVSVLYKDKAWLFSGHTTIGKTTHANLWQHLFGTPLINGDLNLLALENGEPVIHGIPWCGTSGICDTASYPLGGIILLNRAPADSVTELSEAERVLLVNQRLISPSWTRELFDRNWDITRSICPKLCVFRLNCTKEDSAALTSKAFIDSYLAEQR